MYKGGGLGGLVTYRLGQTVNELVAFQFAPPVTVVPFLTITVHGPNAAINPGDSDNIVPLAVRYSLRMKLGGRFYMGGLDRKMRQLGDAARHMIRYPAWKWTNTTYGLSPSSSAAQADDNNKNSKDYVLKLICEPSLGSPSVANCLAAAGELHQTGPLRSN